MDEPTTTLCVGCGAEMDEVTFVDHLDECAEPDLVAVSAKGAEVIALAPRPPVPLVA